MKVYQVIRTTPLFTNHTVAGLYDNKADALAHQRRLKEATEIKEYVETRTLDEMVKSEIAQQYSNKMLDLIHSGEIPTHGTEGDARADYKDKFNAEEFMADELAGMNSIIALKIRDLMKDAVYEVGDSYV